MNTKIFKKLNQLVKDSPQLLLDKNSLQQVINGEFCVDIKIHLTHINSLVQRIDEAVMANYFSKVWQPETKKYKYSGLSIIDEVNATNPANVLDVGCGYNEFKGKIKNLIGIDPYNKRADEMISTLNYETDIKFDTVICLGSINFGSTDTIIREMEKVVNLTKVNGLLIFRVNPGVQHGALESQWIDFFEWNPTFIINIAQALNCTVKKLHKDIPVNGINGYRYYFVLQKN
jgi:hypothetical protein